VFKILIEKKRGTNVPPEFINTNLSFTSHAGDAGAGPQDQLTLGSSRALEIGQALRGSIRLMRIK